MVDTADTTREIRSSGSGRRLTAEEAEFLKRCLLETEPVVVTGDAAPRKTPPMGVPHLPRPKRSLR